MTESKKPSESDVALADRVSAAVAEFNNTMLACRKAGLHVVADMSGSKHRDPMIYHHEVFRTVKTQYDKTVTQTVTVTQKENIPRSLPEKKD